MLSYKLRVSVGRQEQMELQCTSASPSESCKACTKDIFVPIADSGDTDDAEGCDFALTIVVGSFMVEGVGRGCR